MASERLSERFSRMSGSCSGTHVTLRQLLPKLGEGDHALVTLLVAICFMHPFPMPGVSWGLAAMTLAAGYRLAGRKGLWLPASVLDRPLPARPPRVLFGWASSAAKRAESFIKPRAVWLVDHAGSPILHGLAIGACGAMLLIPIPPPTNYPPAISLLLLSVGILEKDAILLVLGYLATVASTAFFAALVLLGWGGLRAVAGL